MTPLQGIWKIRSHRRETPTWRYVNLGNLLLGNWIAGWAFMVTFIPMYLVRVPQEEQMMLESFGEEYRQYMSRTGRMIPRILK